MLLPRVLELRVRKPAQRLHEQHHGRHAGARNLRCVVQRAARQPVRRCRSPRESTRRRARSGRRRRGSARSTRSAPTTPRCPPRPRTARSRPSQATSSRASESAFRCRWSSSCSAVSTTEVTMPGLHTTPPDVHTAPSPTSAAIGRISSASFAAPASASRRLSIGVEPAWAAWPFHVIWWRSTPNVPSTTPSGRSIDSSTGPCSMCSSRYATALSSCFRASSARSRSTPCSRSASGSAMPVRVAALAQLVLIGHRAGGRRRAEERAAEARPLLVGPVDEPHGERRLPVGRDPPQHLDARHDVEAAVEPAAVRHRVDVPADEQRPVGAAREREPLVARLVDLLDRAGRRDLPAEPLARLLPRVGPGHALGAVLVPCQLAELLELRHGALRVQPHSAKLTTVLEPIDGVCRS